MATEKSINSEQIKDFRRKIREFRQAITAQPFFNMFAGRIQEAIPGWNLTISSDDGIPSNPSIDEALRKLRELIKHCPNQDLQIDGYTVNAQEYFRDLFNLFPPPPPTSTEVEDAFQKRRRQEREDRKKKMEAAGSPVPTPTGLSGAMTPPADTVAPDNDHEDDDSPRSDGQPFVADDDTYGADTDDEENEDDEDTHTATSPSPIRPASPPAPGDSPVTSIPFTPTPETKTPAPQPPPPPPPLVPPAKPPATPAAVPFTLRSDSRSGSGGGGMNFKAACDALGYAHKDLGSGQEQGSKADGKEVVTYENKGSSEKWTVQKTSQDRYEVAARFLILQMGKDNFTIQQPNSKEGQIKLHEALARVFDTVKVEHTGKSGASFPGTVAEFLGNISWSHLSSAEASAPAESRPSGRSVDERPTPAGGGAAGKPSSLAAKETTVPYATGARPGH